MAANRFDQAAQMPVINTYVPIDFDQLYRIGATQKAAVDQAIADVSAAVQQFGEFRSPSRVDTENYYNMTIGAMNDLLNEAQANPDIMKDPAFRGRLYNRINSLDYASLSLLRESAEAQRKGLATRAEMEAKGLYNEAWDDSDIPTYDTLGTGRVFDDITPVAYMNANQLSEAYFNNLKPGTIGTVWRDGVKYTATGNTREDLEAVADAHMNDLIATPQGRMYMRDFLRRNNGDQDAARRDFRDMIIASQMDRTLRPTLTVDPAWLAQLRASASRGPQEQPTSWLNRLDYMQNGFSAIGRGNVNRLASEEDKRSIKSNAATLWRDYLVAQQTANRTGSQNDIVAAAEARDRYYQYTGSVTGEYNRQAVLDGFKQKAGFSADSTNVDNEIYSNDKYLAGIEYGLRKVEQDVALLGQKEALLTNLGGLPNKVTNTTGGTQQAYEFRSTDGFILPETVFKQVTQAPGQSPLELRGDVTRHAGLFRDDAFPFQELVETGTFTDIQFIPDGGLIQNGIYDYALRGKLRIPKSQVEDYLGTGVWGNAGADAPNSLGLGIAAGADYLFAPFGRYSTEGNLKDKYNARTVKEKVGDDEIEYVEIDAYRQLPDTYRNSEWWKSTVQLWQNSPSSGGIGGSSQAKEAYPNLDFIE